MSIGPVEVWQQFFTVLPDPFNDYTGIVVPLLIGFKCGFSPKGVFSALSYMLEINHYSGMQ